MRESVQNLPTLNSVQRALRLWPQSGTILAGHFLRWPRWTLDRKPRSRERYAPGASAWTLCPAPGTTAGRIPGASEAMRREIPTNFSSRLTGDGERRDPEVWKLLPERRLVAGPHAPQGCRELGGVVAHLVFDGPAQEVSVPGERREERLPVPVFQETAKVSPLQPCRLLLVGPPSRRPSPRRPRGLGRRTPGRGRRSGPGGGAPGRGRAGRPSSTRRASSAPPPPRPRCRARSGPRPPSRSGPGASRESRRARGGRRRRGRNLRPGRPRRRANPPHAP